MSYLTLAQGVPDFSKAVFSLWFRVPRNSVIAASSHSLPTADENFSMMQNILPLLTYGEIQTNANYQLVVENIVHTSPPNSNVTLVQAIGYTAHTPYEVDPCFIGLVCTSGKTFHLAFNIQMGNKGDYDSLSYFATSLDYQEGAGEQVNTPGSGYIGTGTGSYKSTIVEGTYGIRDAQNEFFYVETNLSLEPDTWHHVLLSFDVSMPLSIGEHASSTCKLWYAVDDVDYRGPENMGPFRDVDDGLGPNTILTSNIYRESGAVPPAGGRLFFNNFIREPSGGYLPAPIPSSKGELGIPAAAHYVNGIFRCELAEFQMWTGVTLDTESQSNRRAFVDANGRPVEPTGTEDKPPPAVKLLGKKPDVLLHGSSNWKTGYNTGTLGVEIDGDGTINKIPNGQFKPWGGIERYKPDPSLDETETA